MRAGRIALLLHFSHYGDEKSFFWAKDVSQEFKAPQSGDLVPLNVIKNDCSPAQFKVFDHALQVQF